MEAARAVGLNATAVEGGDLRFLAALDGAAILHVKQNELPESDYDHWVVYIDRDRERGSYIIFDPAKGTLRLSGGELSRRWSGYAVVVSDTAGAAAQAIQRRNRKPWMLIAGGGLLALNQA